MLPRYEAPLFCCGKRENMFHQRKPAVRTTVQSIFLRCLWIFHNMTKNHLNFKNIAKTQLNYERPIWHCFNKIFLFTWKTVLIKVEHLINLINSTSSEQLIDSTNSFVNTCCFHLVLMFMCFIKHFCIKFDLFWTRVLSL